jgi:hypothetical protein
MVVSDYIKPRGLEEIGLGNMDIGIFRRPRIDDKAGRQKQKPKTTQRKTRQDKIMQDKKRQGKIIQE